MQLDSGDLVRQTAEVLTKVAALTGQSSSVDWAVPVTPDNAEVALDAAQATIADTLADLSLSVEQRGSLSALLVQTYQVRTAARETGFRRRSEAFSAVQDVLDRLRPASTVAELIERAPIELGRLGYERCLISKLHRGRWIARSAYVRDDPGAASAIREAGSRSPRQLDRTLIESELVRRKSSILVTDPQTNPRVHRELLAVTDTKAYVAAPFIVGNKVIGFVHVDAGPDDAVDDFDRGVVGMLSEALGFAFERAVYHERLQTIRRSIVEASGAVVDLVDEMVESDLDEERPARPTGRGAVASEPPARTGAGIGFGSAEIARRLTPRELEVMELMAAGHTNGKIASLLFVTEATVKAHVKHILRKTAGCQPCRGCLQVPAGLIRPAGTLGPGDTSPGPTAASAAFTGGRGGRTRRTSFRARCSPRHPGS
ncbi:LuxR C-terminal-related transcriptional regulator [Pseudonocardia sp. Ae707_Ps1]|uniref:LuxR C-terminal-related transcriptional regulator n=1 Tax=Pseudonocardia sp. Ae707_Ps1 TaxID=1885572 RepID=UPI00094B2640|nr:LuxR C-terminal-related transcriptional regulator [Pseudonocardia sp. Ae707_Ps1]